MAQAVGVKGNKIVFVGSDAELDALIDEGTRVIDLKGRTMTPGFIDCHFHPILYGMMGGAIRDIKYPLCRSVSELKDMISEMVRSTPEGGWIKLWGFDQNKYLEKRYPTLQELDEIAPNHPVQVMRVCGHVCVYNSKALASIGIHTAEEALATSNGEIEVVDGRLTGKTYNLSLFRIWSKIAYTQEEIQSAIKRSNDLLIQSGVTSVHDPGETDAQSYSEMFKACKSGLFKPREYMMLHSIFGKPFSAVDNERFIENGFHTGLGDARFRIGSCKFMIDGGTSGPSCGTRQPYSHDPSLKSTMDWERDEAAAYIQYIHSHDNQCTAHAVGDLAIEYMVEGYEKALRAYPRKPEEHRHRIEHCAIVDQDLVDRMARMGIIPVTNPHFLTINGSDYCRYYGERIHWFFGLRSFLDAGLRPVIGCDAPTATQEIWRGLDGAVNRIDRNTGKVCGEGQRITLAEAIRCYTINGAYASFEDDIKGSIELGKLADLTIFDRDIFAAPPEKIGEARVDMTVIDGEIVFQSEGFSQR